MDKDRKNRTFMDVSNKERAAILVNEMPKKWKRRRRRSRAGHKNEN